MYGQDQGWDRWRGAGATKTQSGEERDETTKGSGKTRRPREVKWLLGTGSFMSDALFKSA